MLNWMSENYGRMVDLFRRFDSDNSGQLSYEEFADGMRELGKKRWYKCQWSFAKKSDRKPNFAIITYTRFMNLLADNNSI